MTTDADARRRIDGLNDQQRDDLARLLKARREAPKPTDVDADVVVLGGGAAGLTLALQLRQARPLIRVTVVEKQGYPLPETTHKVGESTVEIAAHYLRDVLGLADHLETQQIRKFGLRMFFSDGDNGDITRRVELGSSVFPPLSTYQLDRGRLENELVRRCRAAGIRLELGAGVTGHQQRADGVHVVDHVNEGRRSRVTSTWLVDASGRSQFLRRDQGRRRQDNEHHANAAWLRVAHPIDLSTWTDDDEWAARIPEGDRSLSTNHLMGPGYWVWIIRLPSGSTSIGIVAESDTHPFAGFNTLERALGWLAAREPQLAAELTSRADLVQDFRVMGDYSYGSEQVYDGAAKWCATGEAGLFLDPLYSPGLDLIAISNTLVSDLVLRGLDGEDVAVRATIHDTLFRTVADIWISIYRNQYPLMGNARVMSSKVIWDTAFYWGVFGTLFFNNRFQGVMDDRALTGHLTRLTAVSNRMQQFFREWNSIDGGPLTARFIDLYAPLNFMVDLHHGLADDLSDAEFTARFGQNTDVLSQLAGQLVSAVIEHHTGTFDDGVVQIIQTWQRDPLLTELVALHRRRRTDRPMSDGWIALDDTTRLDDWTDHGLRAEKVA
jgi:flavin-dependent dehydrogenase